MIFLVRTEQETNCDVKNDFLSNASLVEKRDGFLGFRLLGFVLARPDHPKPEKWDKLVKLKATRGLLIIQNND